MSRKLALPLFLLTFALCVIFASRTPQPIIEELPPEEAEAPAVLLTKTEKVSGQTVTLKVYEPKDNGFTRYALFDADGVLLETDSVSLGEHEASESFALTARDDVLGFPGFEVETIQGGRMTVRYFYALTEQGFVYAGEAFGHDFDDTAWGDGVWMLDLTGDGRSELVTRSTFGTGVPYVFVYRWNAAEGISQHSGIVWEKADAQLAKLSAPLGSVARAETYHAEDNTVTLTLYTEDGTREVTLPLTEVANAEKKVPQEWINAEGNGVTHDFIDYALPLIQGEPKLPKEDSLPRFARLKKVLAK